MKNHERDIVNSECPSKEHRYTYDATVKRVVDGDTLILDVDLGWEQWAHDQRVRLVGVDAPEPRGETRAAGRAVTHEVYTWLTDRFSLNFRPVTIQTLQDKQGKFGRYMAVVWREGDDESLNAWLLRKGLAVELIY